MIGTVCTQARALFRRRETIRFLTISGLQAGHRDKVLGNLWSLLDPLLFMAVYYFVFGVLFNLAGAGRRLDFLLYIFAGIVGFRFADGVVGQAVNCIRANRGIIHQTNVPKGVFPVSIALARFYDFLCGVLVLMVIILLVGRVPGLQILLVPVLLGLFLIMVLGLSFISADIGVFFVDANNVITVFMRLMFYLSPIFYFVRDRGDYSAMGPFHNRLVQAVYFSNPLAGFIECLRDLLLWNAFPSVYLVTYLFLVSFWSLFVGLYLFGRREGRYAKSI